MRMKKPEIQIRRQSGGNLNCKPINNIHIEQRKATNLSFVSSF